MSVTAQRLEAWPRGRSRVGPNRDEDNFEPDPAALQSILSQGGLTAGSLKPRLQPQGRGGQQPLTPVAQVPRKYAHLQPRYDFFEAGLPGHVMFRPKATPPAGPGASGRGPRRAWDRGLVLAGPRRLATQGTPPLFRQPPAPRPLTEARPRATPHAVAARQSISERKPLVLVYPGDSLARKSLHFGRPPTGGPQGMSSRAEAILRHQGLLGLPRESLSFLLRQSLTPAELDRMFEDDSTESFEAWEKRLKTPKKTPLRRPPARVGTPEPLAPASPLVAGPPSGPVEPATQSASPGAEDSSLEFTSPVGPSQFLAELQADPSTEVQRFEVVYETSADDSVDGSVFKLERSMSLVGLSQASEEELLPQAHEEQTLHKASSESDLPTALKAQDILASALEAHREFLAEQAQIQAEIQALMDQAQERRQRFQVVWGVSPRSINQTRSLKTVLGQHKVEFSSRSTEAERPPVQAPEDVATTIFSPQLQSLEDVFQDDSDLDMDMTQVINGGKKSVTFCNATPITHELTPNWAHVDVPDFLVRRANGHTTFLYTPMPKGARDQGQDEDASSTLPLNTPMAMRSISQKAQAELDLLYDEDEVAVPSKDARENLDFDSD